MSEFNYADFEDRYIRDVVSSEKQWEDEDQVIKDFKNSIYRILQNNIFCCYCRKRLARKKEDQIDHIIFKSDYPNFTFQPKNLVLACKRCNNKKLAKDVLNAQYREEVKNRPWDNYPMETNYYNIIHPYIDNYFDHIRIENDIFYLSKNGSSKGINTIDMVKLHSFDFLEQKVKDCDSSLNYISRNIKNPCDDEKIQIWADFLMKEVGFQKILFDILTVFEDCKSKCTKLAQEEYGFFKRVIQTNNGKFTGSITTLRANIKFIKLINLLSDNNIILELIDQLEQLYKLKDWAPKFEYSLFLAVILLIKYKEGIYDKVNIGKYQVIRQRRQGDLTKKI